MDKPAIIQKAQTLMYGTIAVTTFCVFLNTVAGPVSSEEFLANMVFSALLALCPFFIGRKSNTARFAYVTIIGLSAIVNFYAGDMIRASGRFDMYVAVLMMPVQLFACGLLFGSEQNAWFKKAVPAK